MPLDSALRRELLARSHRLKPAAIISPENLSDSTIAHVRGLFKRANLLKIRVASGDRQARAAVAARLAAGVPCEVVRTIGRVLVLYRCSPDSSDAATVSC